MAEETRTNIGIYIESGGSLTGGPRVAFNLAATLDRNRYRPVVVTNTTGELATWFQNNGIQPHVVPQSARIGIDDGKTLVGGPMGKLAAIVDVWRYNRGIEHLLKLEKVDVLWVRNIKGVLLTGLAARRLGIPLIWDIGMEKTSRGIVRRLHNFGFRMAARVVTEGSFVAPSIFDQKQLRKYGHKIVVNSPALAPDRVQRVARDSMTQFQVDDELRVLSVATLNDRKNQMMLLRAVEKLRTTFPTLRLQIVGPATDDDYKQKLQSFIQEKLLARNVELLGWRDDVPELLHSAHVFTLPSRIEGIPQAVLEAMYARVPVVATAAGGIPDVIRDGETGWLVPIDDEERYCQALHDCLSNENKRRTRSDQARQFAEEHITNTAWYGRYEELFESVRKGKQWN